MSRSVTVPRGGFSKDNITMELLNLFLSPLMDLGKWVIGKSKKPNPATVLKRREELKKEFEMNLPAKNKYGVRTEAIIRDMSRMDSYPDTDEAKKGISPWFKVEVKGLYHKGVEAFISTPKYIKKDEKGDWQFTEHDDEGEKVLAYPVARIPFDLIEHVSWEGDEYYPFPHIYCRFKAFKGQPYESVPFFVERGRGDSKYLIEVEGFTPYDKKKGRWFLKKG